MNRHMRRILFRQRAAIKRMSWLDYPRDPAKKRLWPVFALAPTPEPERSAFLDHRDRDYGHGHGRSPRHPREPRRHVA